MGGATVRICAMPAAGQPCTPLAQIYSDPQLSQAMANPTATDGMGNYYSYAAPGRYEIEISGPGITTKQLPNVVNGQGILILGAGPLPVHRDTASAERDADRADGEHLALSYCVVDTDWANGRTPCSGVGSRGLAARPISYIMLTTKTICSASPFAGLPSSIPASSSPLPEHCPARVRVDACRNVIAREFAGERACTSRLAQNAERRTLEQDYGEKQIWKRRGITWGLRWRTPLQ
jgi:hypothetical protein